MFVRCRKGQEIWSPDAVGDYWFSVRSGAARLCAVLPSGRRQILDLLLPNDFFVSIDKETGLLSLEAVVEGSLLACYPRSQVEALADRDPAIARNIRKMSLQTISRLHQQMLIIGQSTSTKKVGSFLLSMSERLDNRRTESIALPMTRYDIADYLAISVETVSRALTELKRRGAIALDGTRNITIRDPEALEPGYE